MKFLKVIRFDASDEHAFEAAAQEDEWAVSGCFSFAALAPEAPAPEALVGKTRQAFVNGFLGIPSFGRATFAAVGEMTADEHEAVADALARHFIDHYGPPGPAEARAAADEEMAFVADLCAAKPINTVFTVRRLVAEDGNIREEFRVVQAPSEPQHARIWDIADAE